MAYREGKESTRVSVSPKQKHQAPGVNPKNNHWGPENVNSKYGNPIKTALERAFDRIPGFPLEMAVLEITWPS